MGRNWVVWLVWAAMAVGELQGSSGCVEKERMGLLELQKALKPHDLTHLPSDCCLWDGVNCSATTGLVQTLTICPLDTTSLSPVHEYRGYFLNISLFLPFQELLQLNLHRCGFDGFINQADLMKLTRLEKLRMSYNNIRNIVSFQVLASMKDLKYLDISNNSMNINLEGICDAKNIIELDLRFNNIRGHLPRCIDNLTHLQVLDISYNQISGNIPHCIGNLTQLRILDISFNQIIGNVPWTIGNLYNLSSLSLAENYLSGSFSLHVLANSSKLKTLEMSNNHNLFQVETETRSWLPSFQLNALSLSNSNLNKMSNSVIPTFLLHQSELSFIDLSHNKLQDTFPSWLLQNNSHLRILWMTNNSLTGNLTLPNFVHGLKALGISNNNIDGQLSNHLQVFLPSLQQLDVSNNRFEGNLPSLDALKQLQVVDLSFNLFNGELPKTLFAKNASMWHIDLSNNCLSGEISLNLATFPSSNILVLSNNKFNGSIVELPSASLSRLQVLDVSNNLISGRLSNWIADFQINYVT